jgi:integrase
MPKISLFQKLANQPFEISQLAIAIEILKTYNCRAREVLNARWCDFYPNQMLILAGVKKSANVIIRDRFILDLISRLPRLDKEIIFPSLNYYHLYRHCKQFYSHLFVKFKKRHNYKVTHGFRYRAVEQVANEEKIRDILHHRSINSGKFYKLK